MQIYSINSIGKGYLARKVLPPDTLSLVIAITVDHVSSGDDDTDSGRKLDDECFAVMAAKFVW